MTDLPPAGWYDDPTSPVQERWWDGERWTEQTRRKAAPAPQRRAGELRPVGEFLGHAFSMIRKEWDSFLLIAVIGGVVMAVAAALLLRPIIDALDFSGTEITGFESAQVGSVIVFALVLLVVGLVIATAHYWIAWRAATDESAGWASAVQYGLRNFLRFLGWVLAAGVPVVVALFVVTFVARASGGFGALLLLAFFVGAAWWSIVIVFVPAAIVVGSPGSNPITAAMATVRGRWWRIFGRLFVIGLIAAIVINVFTAVLGGLVGAAAFGIEIQVSPDGELEFVKNLGNSLEFFLGVLVFFTVSLVGNVASFCGVTSIAYDVMPRAGSAGPADYGAGAGDLM